MSHRRGGSELGSPQWDTWVPELLLDTVFVDHSSPAATNTTAHQHQHPALPSFLLHGFRQFLPCKTQHS